MFARAISLSVAEVSVAARCFSICIIFFPVGKTLRPTVVSIGAAAVETSAAGIAMETVVLHREARSLLIRSVF